jgi:hypothetical protein
MKVTVDVKHAQATEETQTRGSGMVAEGMMEVHTANATSHEHACYGNFEGAQINLHTRTKLHELTTVK